MCLDPGGKWKLKGSQGGGAHVLAPVLDQLCLNPLSSLIIGCAAWSQSLRFPVCEMGLKMGFSSRCAVRMRQDKMYEGLSVR